MTSPRSRSTATITDSETPSDQRSRDSEPRKRHFPFWVGWNIGGGSLKRLSRSGIPFTKDPRLPANTQVGNELY
ncbi:hypothetical protein ACFVW1_54365, partial [Streptomyces olivochromogenes]|uniref:hypothetical protein n=1 Tax=Streptomyces olivochromogenes TaxID=1963 RepID=UPI0036D94F5A